MFSKATKDLSAGLKLSHVWIYQAYHEISAKYKRTIFGSFWIVGSMVFMSIAFAIVSGALFNQKISDILPYTMGGIMAFNVISTLLSESPEVYISNGGIISNHAYPFTYYTFESATKTFMVLGHNLIVFEIILLLTGHITIPHWSILLALPVVYLNLLTWGCLVSMASARFRDLRFLLPYLITVTMFMTPIMFHADQLTGAKRLLITLNPIYPFVEMIRSPLLGNAMPMEFWTTAAGISALGICLWLIFFDMFRNRISFWV